MRPTKFGTVQVLYFMLVCENLCWCFWPRLAERHEQETSKGSAALETEHGLFVVVDVLFVFSNFMKCTNRVILHSFLFSAAGESLQVSEVVVL